MLKLILHWFYTGAFLCSIFELITKKNKKMGQNCFENLVSEYPKDSKFGHKLTLKKKYKKSNFTIFWFWFFWLQQ